jgi:invasion protein IalB
MSVTTILWSPARAAARTEKTFGKWAVVCVETENAAKSCSMIQSLVQVDKQTNRKRPVLRWTITTNKDRQQTQALTVPTGVSIKEGVRLFLGDAEPIIIGYDFCGPRVCVASAPFDAKEIAAINASKKVSASYVLGSKKLMQVPLDLTGFTEAYDFVVQQLS